MVEQRPMIVTDGELMLAVIWRGGSTFHVRTCDTVPSHDRTVLGVSLNDVDVFTYYGNDNGDPPNITQAYAKIQEWLDNERAMELGEVE